MTTQLVPIPASVRNIAGRVSKATSELVFRADSIGALGYRSFFVSEKPSVAEINEQETVVEISSIGGEVRF